MVENGQSDVDRLPWNCLLPVGMGTRPLLVDAIVAVVPGKQIGEQFDTSLQCGCHVLDLLFTETERLAHVLIDDQVVDRQTLAATGGWQTYVTQTSPSFALSPGKHKVRFRSIGNEWNINWFEIKR